MTTETIITGVRVLPGLDQQPEFVQLRADNLDDIRDYLGCDWVTAVQISVPGVAMWLDEEATLRHGAVLNEHASGILYPGRVYGVALLTRALPGGGMAGLTSQQLDALANLGVKPRRRPQLRTDLQWMSAEETAELTGRVRRRIAQRDGEVTA